MPFMDPQRHIAAQHIQSPLMNEAIRRVSDQRGMLMSGVQMHHYQPHGDVFPGPHPGLVNGSIVMRPPLPHMEKGQPYPTGLHSLSPGEAEALYNCMDPKLWAESMLNPMMLPPMFDSYYSGLDFHAPGYRKNVTKETTGPLKAWLQDHRKNPYPTKAEKIMLAIITKMTLTQVSTWFANARRRLKKETGRSSPDEDGEELRGLSEDEGEDSDISHSKHGSDHEDDCEEISVDDDGDDEASSDRSHPGDCNRLTATREIPATSSAATGSCAPLSSREFSGEQARQRNTSSTKSNTTDTNHIDYAVATCSSATNTHDRHKLLPPVSEAEARPVDLSQNQSSPRNNTCPQQREASRQRPGDNVTNHSPVNNPVTPKAKIWSISNILSLESSEQST